MKVLVFSDSHGFEQKIVNMLAAEPECKLALFLGDGIRDVENIAPEHPDIKFMSVKGNNDMDFFKMDVNYKHVDGVTMMFTHGHTLGVREGLRDLFLQANAVKADLVLYGHTHIQKITEDPFSRVTAVNPGALCGGNYCVLDIEKGKFDVQLKRL